jgi:hypothetical protein
MADPRRINDLTVRPGPPLEQDEAGPQIGDYLLPRIDPNIEQATLLEDLLGSLGGVQAPTPENFWEGLLVGGARGLSGAGQRHKAERERFNEIERKRSAARDAENLKATADFRKDRRTFLSQSSAEQKKQRDYERDNPIVDDKLIAAYPGIETLKTMKGQTVNKAMLGRIALTPKKSTDNAATDDYATEIADAIEAGTQQPDTRGLFRLAGPVRAILGKRGYNLLAANTDWLATQRTIATLNGPQQTRLRQAAQTAYESLDVIDDLATKLAQAMGTTDITRLNKAKLDAAIGGAPGFSPEARQLATQLRAQVTDVVSELGNVYMGGNSPTDHSLALAGQNLNANWSLPQLKSATALARKNLAIRRNSIANSQPIVPGQAPQRPPLDSFVRP